VLITYRLTFHPLAKYPGPFLAKITDLHQAYHALKGDRQVEFYRCHQKYGDIVRFGPNSISINTNTALKSIYGFKANVRKADFYRVFPPTKTAFSTHTSIDKNEHARKRRVLSHAFSDTAIKAMDKFILNHVRSFCAQLDSGSSALSPLSPSSNNEKEKRPWSPAKNISDLCNYLTFDIMGDLCFGNDSFGMLERPDNRFVIDLISNSAHRHLICGTYPPLHTYHLDHYLFPAIAASRARYMTFGRSLSTARTKLGTDASRKDFFYYLLNATDPETGKGFSMTELWAEANLLIVAGSDTSSTALAGAIYYLVHNPAALKRLEEEICGAFGDVEDIHSGPVLSGCAYLRACLDEAMRLSPPVGGLLPRTVLDGGISIDGHHFPGGTVVGTPHYTIHHNAAYYPSPFTYSPERWYPGSSPSVTAESVELAHSAFCPFSIGPRGCIGKGLAYTELMTALARIIWLLEMRLKPGESLGSVSVTAAEVEETPERVGEFALKDTFTSVKNGPLVEFRRRGEIERNE